jgi:NAD(P)-dependent dehydrogenase (short-subunit alcohol dehydrogenase family)
MMAAHRSLDGPVALVTGGGQGMGRAVAATLAARGARLAINDIDADRAHRAVEELAADGAEARAVPADITSKAAVAAMVERTLAAFDGLHILVNNAGILYPTAVADMEEQEWDRVIDVNLKGTFLCAQAVLPAMTSAGWGRIVNFSSTAGKSVSTLGGAHYTASKAGVLGFTRHLAKEVAALGITVNAVCPGLIDTEMVRGTVDAERARAYAEGFPIQRLGKPEEVADLVAFLASEEAAYITGAAVDINGGDLMV